MDKNQTTLKRLATFYCSKSLIFLYLIHLIHWDKGYIEKVKSGYQEVGVLEKQGKMGIN